MRRGLMQDYANQIAQMFVGWQITVADLPRLAEIGRGRIEIELLSGLTMIDQVGCEPLAIAAAVRGWVDEAVRRDGLAAGFVREVSIICDFEVAERLIGTGDEWRVRLDCTATVSAENGVWSGSSRKAERWSRTGSAPWVVTDL